MFSQGSFINNPNATPEELARKRQQLAELIAGQSRPMSVGEGLADAGTAIIAALGDRKLDRKEGEARERATNQYEDVLGGWNPFGGNISTSGDASSDPNATRNSAMAANGGPTNAAAAQMGGLPASLVQSESGGNWRALNSEGYGGRGQFGAARLADAARAGIIPPGMTGEQYSQQPESVQLAVENWHKQDILGNLGQYVGTDVDGPGPIPPLTEDSILSVAHLGGTGGARKFIESGGRYNPSDSNGTSLADYASRHAGGGNVSTQGSGGYPAYTGPAVQDLAQLMANPWLTPEQRSVVAMQLQQAQQASDPMRQLQWQQAQQQMALNEEKLRQMQNPKTVRTLSTEEAGQLGLPAGGVYQMDPEGNISTAAAAPKPSSVADQYRVVGNTLYDLGAEGGPKPVGEGQGQEMVVYGPNGEPIMVQGPTGSSAKFTEGQSKDNVYSTRARGALEVLDPLAETLTSRVDRGAEMVPFGLARGVQSDDYQVAQQAGTEFLQAILRKDTGAAITTDETESYGRVYLPQPGDGPAVLEAKRQARIRAVNAIESGMNPSQMLARDRALLKSEIEAGTYEGDGSPAPQSPQAEPKRLRYNPETGELE